MEDLRRNRIGSPFAVVTRKGRSESLIRSAIRRGTIAVRDREQRIKLGLDIGYAANTNIPRDTGN